jgi:integrase
MARRIRSADLETRSARLRLPVSRKPVWVRIGHGLGQGYRRNQAQGSWNGRIADGKGGYKTFLIGEADDFAAANGDTILDFWQAQDKIRTVGLGARYGDHDTKLATVGDAVAAYEQELERLGGDTHNASRVRGHLPNVLADKIVGALTTRDFAPWKNALTKAGIKPDTINRVNNALRAALNLSARNDERIHNKHVWEISLAAIPDVGEARNVILPEESVRDLVFAAYRVSPQFGLLTEVAANTGARISQIANLEVQDLQVDRLRVMMPSSRKGRGRRHVDRYPVPIPQSLAMRLAEAGQGRPPHSPLLLKPSGAQWRKSDHLRPFRVAARDARLDNEVTFYSLRHSSIVRSLLAGTPIRVTAVVHNTSVLMIEKTYSPFIGDHSDAVVRRGLIDFAQPSATNVVPLTERNSL